MSRIYKAQWPITTSEPVPYVLVYPDADRSEQHLIPATPEIHKNIFDNRWFRVYFRGRIDGENIIVEEFIRQKEWV